MKFKLWREYGALNSVPVFAAVEQGLKKIGQTVVDNGQDVDVIWSVLWHGRMRPNKDIYERAISQGKSVLIIEIGNLFRGRTWRISVDHIHGLGKFGNDIDLDNDRPKKLGVILKDYKNQRKNSILIACQHEHSLQWAGQQPMGEWAVDTIKKIREKSDRPIIVRPHPRSLFSIKMPGVTVSQPIKIPNTYDDFNIDYDHHCVINHNSGPAVRSAIEGVPIICDVSSLAWPVSDIMENIETVSLPYRQEWLTKLCHTEWTIDEISKGQPFHRILSEIKIK